jgi:pyruvate carboxylase
MADGKNPYHIAAPFDADLWVVHKKEGDTVKADEEVLNLTIMKTESAMTSPVDGVVKRVVVFADYKTDKKMVSVKKGQLLMELAPPREQCASCDAEIEEDYKFCPNCGHDVGSQ